MVTNVKAKPKAKAKPTTIDEYFEALCQDKRAALQRLRKIIRAAAQPRITVPFMAS